ERPELVDRHRPGGGARAQRHLPHAGRRPGPRLPRRPGRGLARAAVQPDEPPAHLPRGGGAERADLRPARAVLPPEPARRAGRRARHLVHELRNPGRHVSLWRHRDFMRLWAGESVSVLGSMVTMLALPLAAVLTLHASAFEMGVLSAAGMAPWLLFALLVGVWVDRQPRRRWVLIASDLGQALLLSTVPIAAALHRLTYAQLVAVAFLTGVLALFFRVAYTAYLPSLIHKSQLVDGNSKMMASW